MPSGTAAAVDEEPAFEEVPGSAAAAVGDQVAVEVEAGGFGGRAKRSGMARWWDQKMETSVWLGSANGCA